MAEDEGGTNPMHLRCDMQHTLFQQQFIVHAPQRSHDHSRDAAAAAAVASAGASAGTGIPSGIRPAACSSTHS
jgi:hypothetical protein